MESHGCQLHVTSVMYPAVAWRRVGEEGSEEDRECGAEGKGRREDGGGRRRMIGVRTGRRGVIDWTWMYGDGKG